MNKIIYSFFTFFISMSLFANTGKVVFSGKVQNHSITTVQITALDHKEVASSKIDASGVFEMTMRIENGYYLLKYGRNTTYIYLFPKDKISAEFDANHFNETMTFSGKGSERNNYLAEKSKTNLELTKDLDAYYKVDETTYLKNLEDVKNIHWKKLATYNVEKKFIEEEKKSLEYERLFSIQNYASTYAFYLGEEISPSDHFYASLEKLKLDNEKTYEKQPYYRYLATSVWSKRIDEQPDVDGMLQELRKVPFQSLAIHLVNGFYSKISRSNERSKDYLELIKKVTKHKPFIDAAEKKYQEAIASKGLKKRDVSPDFSYETIDGEKIQLSDLKGKYIYIDVWATWCAPCIKQIPYLKKLEALYHDKNILFVSISVDKKNLKERWKQMILEKQLGGIQLFADQSFDSAFMNAYGVNSIPRFILIDPEGNIVDAEAPRPSFEKTKNLLDELLN